MVQLTYAHICQLNPAVPTADNRHTTLSTFEEFGPTADGDVVPALLGELLQGVYEKALWEIVHHNADEIPKTIRYQVSQIG